MYMRVDGSGIDQHHLTWMSEKKERKTGSSMDRYDCFAHWIDNRERQKKLTLSFCYCCRRVIDLHPLLANVHHSSLSGFSIAGRYIHAPAGHKRRRRSKKNYVYFFEWVKKRKTTLFWLLSHIENRKMASRAWKTSPLFNAHHPSKRHHILVI